MLNAILGANSHICLYGSKEDAYEVHGSDANRTTILRRKIHGCLLGTWNDFAQRKWAFFIPCK